MQVSDKLSEMYDGYYDSEVAKKREIAARQTIAHIKRLLPDFPYHRLIDIGAGEGSVLAELDRNMFAKELYAVEISQTGIDAVHARKIPSLRAIQPFDGYKIDSADRTYDLGIAIHVLEHVEHERAFIAEIIRACKIAYLEVPLELTIRVERAIRTSGKYGHINFYTPSSFKNLLRTSNADILKFCVFPNSREYEVFVSGSLRGTIKHVVRSTALRVAPQVATYAMTYLAGAVVKRKTD